MPEPPTGVTSITVNWQWSCPDAAPPPLAVTSSTICIACNVAIAIRVGSSGDTGAVTQVTGAASGATAATTALVPQTVAQGVSAPPPAPPEPPAVPAAPAFPSVPVIPAVPPLPVLPAVQALFVSPLEVPGMVVIPGAPAAFSIGAIVGAGGDLPRHGPPAFDRSASTPRPGAAPTPRSEGRVVVVAAATASASSSIETYSSEERAEPRGAGGRPRRTPPTPRAPLAPEAPSSSLTLSAPAAGPHGPAGASVALWIGALSLGGLAGLVLVSLLDLRVRGLLARARPHPPG